MRAALARFSLLSFLNLSCARSPSALKQAPSMAFYIAIVVAEIVTIIVIAVAAFMLKRCK